MPNEHFECTYCGHHFKEWIGQAYQKDWLKCPKCKDRNLIHHEKKDVFGYEWKDAHERDKRKG